jgi:hypothetical protein
MKANGRYVILASLISLALCLLVFGCATTDDHGLSKIAGEQEQEIARIAIEEVRNNWGLKKFVVYNVGKSGDHWMVGISPIPPIPGSARVMVIGKDGKIIEVLGGGRDPGPAR